MVVDTKTIVWRRRAARTLVVLLGACAFMAAPAQARSVIELFTSQGCPKCPPADQLITEFSKDPDTIALSFAVNYWDYIGWKDTLASPAFTARQNAYADARGDRRVFTPQAIVNGRAVEAGADRSAIVHDMQATSLGRDIPLSIAEDNGTLRIHVGTGAAPGPVGVYVMRVARSKTVLIGRGENAGRSVTYTNAVRAMNKVGDWSGQATDFDMVELKGDDEGYVVLLQSGRPDSPGAILAAAKTSDL